MHFDSAGVDITFRLNVLMEMATGDPAIEELNATDLYDAVPLINLEAGGLRIQYNLTPIQCQLLSVQRYRDSRGGPLSRSRRGRCAP